VPLTRKEKEVVVEDLQKVFNDSGSVVFVRFHGLPVSSANEMRRSLRKAGVEYKVAKKTYTRIALTNSKIGGELPPVEGELAIAYSDDETAAAREVYSFQKKLDGAVSIQGGIFHDEIVNREQMTEIAQIPGLLELRGMFVNLINSPLQRFAIVLDQIAQTKN
jgi:large subunit ribosomal protein L10